MCAYSVHLLQYFLVCCSGSIVTERHKMARWFIHSKARNMEDAPGPRTPSIHPQGSEPEYGPNRTHGSLYTVGLKRVRIQRAYVGVEKQEAIWKTFSALKPSQNITFRFINTVNSTKTLHYNGLTCLPVNHRLLNVITLSLICDLMRESRHVAANLIGFIYEPRIRTSELDPERVMDVNK